MLRSYAMAKEQEKNQFPERIDDTGLTNIGQGSVDILTLPTVVVVGRRNDGTPIVASFDIIGGQEVCEGDSWAFSVGDKTNNLTTQDIVQWRVEQQALDGGPLLENLQISSTGGITADIPGERGDQSVSGADDIMQDHNYKITVGVLLASGRGGIKSDFNLLVEAAPDWTSNTVSSFLEERSTKTSTNISRFVNNNPTSYSIISQPRVIKAEKAAPDPSVPGGFVLVNAPEGLASAPSISYTINNNGLLQLTSARVPSVLFKYTYTMEIRAQNDCGWDDTPWGIVIQEITLSTSNALGDGTLHTEGNEETMPPMLTGSMRPFIQKNGEDVPQGADFFVLDSNNRPTPAVQVLRSDPSGWQPTFSVNQSNGAITLSNVPLVLYTSHRNYTCEIFIRVLAYNTRGAIKMEGRYTIEAVEPRWSARPFLSPCDERQQNVTFTVTPRTDIVNYDKAHSTSDPLTFSIVSDGIGNARINQNTGTVTYDAPEVVGSTDPTARNYNPSDEYTITIRCENEAGENDKSITITVTNTTSDPPSGGTHEPEVFTTYSDGYGVVEDYTIEEGEEFNFNIRQYLNARWFLNKQRAGLPWHFFLTEIMATPSPGPPPNMAITFGPSPRISTDPAVVIPAWERELARIPNRLIIHETTGVLTGIGDLEDAPLVNDRHEQYRITFEVRDDRIQPASQTQQGRFYLNINQKAPVINDIELDDITENSEIAFSVNTSKLNPSTNMMESTIENDPTGFDIGTGAALRVAASGEDAPPTAPSLDIDDDGNVTSDDDSPDIKQEEQYSYPLTAKNTLNYATTSERNNFEQETTRNIIVTFVEEIPEWQEDIPDQSFEEGSEIDLGLITFVDNDPDTFALVEITKQDSNAPDLNVSVDETTGRLTATAPLLDLDYSYDVEVSCANSAGNADPNGEFTIIITNKKPQFTGTTTFEMNESSTEAFRVFDYITDETKDQETPATMTFAVGAPRLTSSHTPNPTATAAIVPPNTSAIFSVTASNVAGSTDAYFTVPVTATNNAGSTSENFTVKVLNATDNPVFTLCNNQSFPESRTRTFRIRATHELAIAYSKQSGESWGTVNRSTGVVTVVLPAVTGSISANPWDDFNFTFRASVTDSDNNTFTADCTLRVRVLNTTAPPVGTAASWTRIPDRMILERAEIDFNIGIYASGNPEPGVGFTPDADNPSYLRISSDGSGQLTGTADPVASTSASSTRDGLIWQLTISTGASLTPTDFSFNSGILGDGNSLVEVIQGGTRTLHFLRFSRSVENIRTTDFTISGATATNMQQSWYADDTVYVTAVNIAAGSINSPATSFKIYRVNTETGITDDQAPQLNVPDQMANELTNGQPTIWRLDLNRYTTGTAPFSYERTLIGEGPRRFSLPDLRDSGGTAMTLTPMGILEVTFGTITEDETHRIYVTARNAVGFDSNAGIERNYFTLTITDDPSTEYEEPNLSISNKTYPESRPQATPPVTTVIRIAPLETGEMTGNPAPTLSLTNPTTSPLPDYLALQDNRIVLLGNAPANLAADRVDTVRLTASNTDPNGQVMTDTDIFTITITDESGPHRNPSWHNVVDLTFTEGDPIVFDPIVNNQLRGSAPLGIRLTDGTADPLPFGLALDTDDNRVEGVAPAPAGGAATQTGTVKLTGFNTDDNGVEQTATTEFDITINKKPTDYAMPVWTQGDLTFVDGDEVVIDPIKDGTLTGNPTPTISLTDGMNFPLPPWLPLRSQVLSGTAESRELPYVIKLRATNTNPNNMETVIVDHEFTITVSDEVVDPDCEPPIVFKIRKQTIYTGEIDSIDIREYIRGGTDEVPPQVVADPDFAVPGFITSESYGIGLVPYNVPALRRDYERYVGDIHELFIIVSACGRERKTSFLINVKQAVVNPPVIGECPDVVMNMSINYNEATGTFDNPSTHNDNMNQYLESTHTIESPTWAKESTGLTDTWQTADWWTIDSAGNLNITAPRVPRTTTESLTVRAVNPDGFDTCSFRLTVNYVPEPPICHIPDVIEINERARIDFPVDVSPDGRPYIRNTFTNIRINSVTKVTTTPEPPELFLKPIEPPSHLVGRIQGATNADQSAVGTGPLLPSGDDATVTTTSAPDVAADSDYLVNMTVINTGLILTQDQQSNSDTCTFTLRIKDVIVGIDPPNWLEIPPQTTVARQNISKNIGQYARNSPTSYEILSVTHASGYNAGPIFLEADNAGRVTRQGGAVAPDVPQVAKYNVTIRARNAGGFADATYEWQIIPRPTEAPGAPAFIISEYLNFGGDQGYSLWEYDPQTGTTQGPRHHIIRSSIGSNLYIEGVGSTLYALSNSKKLATISYTGTGATINELGDVIPSSISEFRGLTSVGTTLYSFGLDSGTWRLYSIDPGTRTATPVNSATSANNFGFSTVTPGGLTAIGTTTYSVVRVTSATDVRFISIPASGSSSTRGIAVTINSNLGAINPIRGLETFGTVIQGLLTSGGSSVKNINRTTGGLTVVGGSTTQRWNSFTQYAISKPTCITIPPLLVQEGQLINFPLAAYFTGANSYTLGRITVPPGAPSVSLQINAAGTITGTGTTVNAPLVVDNSYYTFFVYGVNSAGRTPCLATMGILNGPPIWGAIPEQFINEGQLIRIPLLTFVQNNPTHFAITGYTKDNDESPNLELQIRGNGEIIGVGSTVNAPEVSENRRYVISVRAENTAGPRSTTFGFTIRDLGDPNQRVPFVERWDTPEGAQDGAFVILVDMNIPCHSLRPASFQIDGVDFRGEPFLLWSPNPADDIPANRPTADQRNLDYLTTPVPQRGTRYYKLEFPRAILPEVIERDEIINVYLKAGEARGGLTS